MIIFENSLRFPSSREIEKVYKQVCADRNVYNQWLWLYLAGGQVKLDTLESFCFDCLRRGRTEMESYEYNSGTLPKGIEVWAKSR